MGDLPFLVTSDVPVKYLEQSRFTAFYSKGQDHFARTLYTCVKDSSVQLKPLSTSERSGILREFKYPSLVFEAPSWNSPVFNSPQVRRRLSECRNHGEKVSLDIRSQSVTVIDSLLHQVDLFYSEQNSELITDGIIDPGLFSHFLHHKNALMIHCSCVSFEEGGAVFLAMDEGGKTTAAGLCSRGRVLSDDKILFRRQDGGQWLVHGTPWTTFPPDPRHAVPSAFFLLEKADEFSLEKLSSRELLSFLWNEHYSTRYQISSQQQTALFDLYMSLSSSAPVYLMKFNGKHIDQEAIQRCLRT